MLSFNKILLKYRGGNTIKLVESGHEYFDTLIHLIDNARGDIHLQTYILSGDATGQRVLDALILARSKGVEVFLLTDSYGSRALDFELVHKARDAGINFRFFSPVVTLRGFNLGRHLHHKVVVVDGEKALIGGINIADRYSGESGSRPWFDFAVLVEGSICEGITKICEKLWGRKFTTLERRQDRKLLTRFRKSNDTLIQIVQNDRLRKKSEISKSIRAAIRRAEHEIIIVGAYFLPSLRLRHLLMNARKRGVRVRIILSKKSDELIFQLAMNYLYTWLLRHNIEIYEYKPSVVHGKAILVDREWFSIGSHDFNFLSTYGLIEMNINVMDQKLASKFAYKLDRIITESCEKLDGYEIEGKIVQKILAYLTYVSIRFSLWFITLFTAKDTNER